MVDVFLIVSIAVALVILLVVGFYCLVYYQHPDDYNDAYLPKLVVLLGFVLAGATVLLLPLDVANNGSYAGKKQRKRVVGVVLPVLLWLCSENQNNGMVRFNFGLPMIIFFNFSPFFYFDNTGTHRLRRVQYHHLWWSQHESHVGNFLLVNSHLGLFVDSLYDVLLRSRRWHAHGRNGLRTRTDS